MKMLLFCLFYACTSFAEDLSFQAWIQNFKKIALEKGIQPETLELAFDKLEPNSEVIKQYKRQLKSDSSFLGYVSKLFVLNRRIEEGRKKLIQHQDLLEEVSNTYLVPAEYIVALWGVETRYGQETENYPVIQSLATLAWKSRRQKMFSAELILALKMVDEGHIPLKNFKGSWAGATGQCQFMPSTFSSYAVEVTIDGKKKKDIWSSPPTIFASIANYLHKLGWNQEQPWGYQITLPPDFKEKIGLEIKYKNEELQRLNVRKMGGSDLTFLQTETSIIQPLGAWGPTYLVYPNFRIILKWNKSQKFALSVSILADGLTR